MAYKLRVEKDEIKIWRFLNARMKLTKDEKQHFLNLEKGFKGELMFDQHTDKLPAGHLILNDLLLEVDGRKFQIDTVGIIQEWIHLFEIKNLEGNYIYENGKICRVNPRKEISNPLDQVKRSEFLLRKLIESYGFHLPIIQHVVFINPEFTLYQAPLDVPLIMPTQINAFMKNYSMAPSTLNSLHYNLAEKLVSLHQIDDPFLRVRRYRFGDLKKGILCGTCYSFMYLVNGGDNLVCPCCGAHEKMDSAVLRNVKELQLLFPDAKITTNLVFDWCEGIVSKKAFRRVLKGNYQTLGNKKYTYYE
ncbi:nuclease-related domain-containing protein [Neobacillus sp. SM06]|uniref:nuclease-related domain-containing protein n=1 Tax=Neobacillus sp. SM06 TaxID=3422492 RepID=UPI003D285C70